jgi:hypothetical protein
MEKFKRICTSIFIVFTVFLCSNCFLLKQKYHEKLLIDGKIGSGPGEIRWQTIDYLPTGPTSFGINNRDEIFILDYLNHRIVKFDSKGNYADEILQGAHLNLMDIAFNKRGDVFIEYVSGDVSIYDKGLSFIRTLDLKAPVPPITPEMTHLEVTDGGTILLVDPNLDQVDQIIEVDTAGNVIQTKDNLHGYIETKGKYYVKATSSGNKILYNASNGKAIFSLAKLKAGKGKPQVIGIDSLENVYFIVPMETFMQDRIVKVNRRGWRRADFTVKTSPGHADVCRTIRVSPGGKVFVLDDDNERFHLWEYSP